MNSQETRDKVASPFLKVIFYHLSPFYGFFSLCSGPIFSHVTYTENYPDLSNLWTTNFYGSGQIGFGISINKYWGISLTGSCSIISFTNRLCIFLTPQLSLDLKF